MEKQPENQVLQKYDSCLSKFYKPVQVLWYILLEHNKPGIFQLYQRKNFSSICYSLLHRLAVCIQDNKATENFFEMKEKQRLYSHNLQESKEQSAHLFLLKLQVYENLSIIFEQEHYETEKVRIYLKLLLQC